jgi:hypothetical protein
MSNPVAATAADHPVEQDERPKPKDNWDRAGILLQAVVPIILAVLTTMYGCYERQDQKAESQRIAAMNAMDAARTAAMDTQRMETARAGAVAALLPFIKSNPDSAQAEVVATTLTELGYDRLALHLAQFGGTWNAVGSLTAIARTTQNPAIRDSAIAALARISDQTAPAVGGAAFTAAADSALARLQSAGSAVRADGWAVVIGGFGSTQAAVADARAAQAKGYRAGVFVRNGVARTAIRYENRAAAAAALPEIRRRIRRGAYGVNFAGWCPGMTQVSDHFTCDRSAPERVEFQ